MRSGIAIVGGVLLLIAAVLFFEAAFVVSEFEQVIITQFGKPVGSPITAPGLHFKKPFLQKARYFEKRIMRWGGDPNQVPTRDKRFIFVDTTARWRISDPLQFLLTVRDETGAQNRLNDILDGETRNWVSSHKLVEIVRTTNREMAFSDVTAELLGDMQLEKIEVGRASITQGILEAARAELRQLGIELVDFRITSINYVDKVQEEVYERMISERRRIAQQYRSEGEGKAAQIRGEMDRDRKQIESEAYRKAEEIKGKADAEAITIYAEAYGQDPDFYQFHSTLETWKQALKEGTTLLLTTDSELFGYFKHLQLEGARGGGGRPPPPPPPPPRGGGHGSAAPGMKLGPVSSPGGRPRRWTTQTQRAWSMAGTETVTVSVTESVTLTGKAPRTRTVPASWSAGQLKLSSKASKRIPRGAGARRCGRRPSRRRMERARRCAAPRAQWLGQSERRAAPHREPGSRL
ncbi:MAG: protease modulator HflC [Planctomycetota bacterium]